jgi:mRNA guanylyltransferase
MKAMYKSYRIDHVFNDVLPKLEHGNDGLIFTPVNFPYVLGTCTKL